ncbi:hypothetical protein CDAR_577791 [Caerostris darwini]|uniref:Uncharacterized protein n=1 Tax=Caerostris darwini TaxID=1538125 RepID=A0AAV4RE32_9ARAC|nr:hypothetical protein CDAR_577791 [Caerostris darwini]
MKGHGGYKGFPVLGGIQEISRREVSHTVKWDSWKEKVLGEFPVDGCCGICFIRRDELSFPEGQQNVLEGMHHLTLLLTFSGIKCCAVERPYPELDLIGFSDFQLLGNSG